MSFPNLKSSAESPVSIWIRGHYVLAGELRLQIEYCPDTMITKRPTLFEILKTALYIGAVGYGGPAILALMKRVIVHEKEWISDEEFMNALSLSQILPGATGVTLLGYIGQKLQGGWGGILMPFTFAFPAMAAITVLAWAYFSFGDLKFVHSIFMGLGAMVVALLINATLMMGRSVFQGMDRNALKGIVIAALSFLGILYLRWNVVLSSCNSASNPSSTGRHGPCLRYP